VGHSNVGWEVMVVNDFYKFIYFLMPRTASRAIKKSLLSIRWSYAPHDPKRHVFLPPDNTQDYFSFCGQRNPFQRVVSHYRY